MAAMGGEEAAALEARLGMSPALLPPPLRSYAVQRRSESTFSGPGLLPGEVEEGHVEYKLRLLQPTPARFQQLVSQLTWRLAEGNGEALYALGVEDNGHPQGLPQHELDASLDVLRAMAKEASAVADVLQTPPGAAEGLRCAVVCLTRAAPPPPALDFVDLRLAVAGGADSGKSTLIGVLTSGAGGAPALDNGRGSSRMQVFRHKHEIESGQTSCISLRTLAYDAQGGVLNYQSSLPPAEAVGAAARCLRCFDLGGHERYAKTALHGLTSMLPDCALLCVSAATGVSWATREHLAVALALGIPLAAVLTKADLASEAAAAAAADELRALLAGAVEQSGGAPWDAAALAPLVTSEAQARALAASMHRSRVSVAGAGLCVPLFATSAVTGDGLQLLHAFLNALDLGGGGDGPTAAAAVAAATAAPPDSMQGWRQQRGGGGEDPTQFQIDGGFEVSGVGTVFSGTVVSGTLRLGSQLLLGPLEGGAFERVRVSSIHRSKVEVGEAAAGQHATVAVRALEGGGDGAPAGAPPPPADGPVLAGSAGCLHAWMRQSASQAHLLEASPTADCAAGSSRVGASLPRLEASTPALDIAAAGGGGGAALASSHSAAQLGGSLLSSCGSGELHRWASSPQLAGSSPRPAPRPRKGAVLLEPSLQPAACTQFEAVLVLLGGHWPPRGLLSGCYPAEDEGPPLEPPLLPSAGSLGAVAASDGSTGGLPGGSLGARPLSLGKLQRAGSRRRAAAYTPVVHCGSIRQAAQVVAMRELPLPLLPGEPGPAAAAEEEDCLAALFGGDLATEPSGDSAAASAAAPATTQPDVRRLAGALAAAGVLLPQPLPGSTPSSSCLGASAASGSGSSGQGSGHASGGEGGAPAAAAGAAGGQGAELAAALQRQRSLLACDDVGCVAAVTFQFQHQPEWLVQGARLIVRDRSTGRTAGAGYIAALLPQREAADC